MAHTNTTETVLVCAGRMADQISTVQQRRWAVPTTYHQSTDNHPPIPLFYRIYNSRTQAAATTNGRID